MKKFVPVFLAACLFATPAFAWWHPYHPYPPQPSVGDEIGSIVGGLINGIGNLITPAPTTPKPWTPQWEDYCHAKYKTFDPRTGFFIGGDGKDHFCR